VSFLNNKFIKKKFIFILIILGLLVSTQLFYEPFQQDPVRVNKPIPVLAQKNIKPQREGVKPALPVPSARPPQRKGLLSQRYRFAEVDQYVKKNRMQLALCLLKNKEFGEVRIQMRLDWDGSGALSQVGLSPDPGQGVKDCIKNLVSRWPLPSHPGLQPFSYRATLAPSAF